MTVVSYDGKRITPAPFVNITKNFNKNAGGEIVGATYDITVTGKLVLGKGSPSESGFATDPASWSTDNFWFVGGTPADEARSASTQLRTMQRKSESLRNLFRDSAEGKSFEIQPCDGTAPLKFNPRIVGLDLADGPWTDFIDYTVNLETDIIYGVLIPSGEDTFNIGTVSQFITDAQESWILEDADVPENVHSTLQHTFRLTHNVSAVGKRFYDETGLLEKEAWEQAKDYVIQKLGITTADLRSSGNMFVPNDIQAFNHIRSETIDRGAGSYIATETWLLLNASGINESGGRAFEDFDITTDASNDRAIKTVSINGTITGLETMIFAASTGDADQMVQTTKYASASGFFNIVENQLFGRAQTYSGLSLNMQPVRTVVGKNPVLGLINYTFDYDTRPSTCISGALSEIITISDTNPNDVFAILPVLGRQAGPVLQNINTFTESRRSVSIEVVMPTPSGCANTFETVAALIDAKPDSKVAVIMDAFEEHLDNNFVKVFRESDTSEWNPVENRYSRVTAWVYQ